MSFCILFKSYMILKFVKGCNFCNVSFFVEVYTSLKFSEIIDSDLVDYSLLTLFNEVLLEFQIKKSS